MSSEQNRKLEDDCRNLCYAIEELPASEQQTRISCLANELSTSILAALDEAEQRGREAERTRPVPEFTDEELETVFSEFWHARWPHQTRDVEKLKQSAHYTGCKDAFYAGVKAGRGKA